MWVPFGALFTWGPLGPFGAHFLFVWALGTLGHWFYMWALGALNSPPDSAFGTLQLEIQKYAT